MLTINVVTLFPEVFGGALGLRFTAGGTVVHRIPLAADFRAELERRCLVVYTGQSRMSGDTINAVIDAYRAREARVLMALERSRELAEQMADALRRADLDSLQWYAD